MKVPQHVYDAIDAAVEKGATRLDQRRPNWYHDIDLRTLDLGDGCLCVCGQLYGSYDERSVATIVGGWVRSLVSHGVPWVNDGYDKVAARYGFITPPEADAWVEKGFDIELRSKVTWNRLERKWKEQIKARLAAEQQVAA